MSPRNRFSYKEEIVHHDGFTSSKTLYRLPRIYKLLNDTKVRCQSMAKKSDVQRKCSIPTELFFPQLHSQILSYLYVHCLTCDCMLDVIGLVGHLLQFIQKRRPTKPITFIIHQLLVRHEHTVSVKRLPIIIMVMFLRKK